MAYYNTIKLVSGDDLPELNITLRDSNEAATGATLDITDPSTWNPIDLTAVSAVRIKFRAVGSTTLTSTVACTLVAPLTDGIVNMSWGLTDLDGISGDYEGEIELEYSSGRFLSVPDLLKFDVRAGF
jgi:hypothetical protein